MAFGRSTTFSIITGSEMESNANERHSIQPFLGAVNLKAGSPAVSKAH